MIKFDNIQDVRLLYGGKFYLINKLAKKTVPSDKELNQNKQLSDSQILNATPIEWKTRKGASISLIISKADFQDKSKTNYLKQLLDEFNMPTNLFGFGVYSDNCDWGTLSNMPTSYGIIFSSNLNMPDVIPLNVVTLADIIDTEEFKKSFLDALQKIIISL